MSTFCDASFNTSKVEFRARQAHEPDANWESSIVSPLQQSRNGVPAQSGLKRES